MFYVVFNTDWFRVCDNDICIKSFVTRQTAEEFINNMNSNTNSLIALFEGSLVCTGGEMAIEENL